MRIPLLIILISCSAMMSKRLLAQMSATEHIIHALFEKPDRVQWFRHYHGRIDGLNEVSVALGYDGKKCKGFLTYLRSKEAIQLEGTLKNNLISLEEINREGAVSGNIKGEVKGDKIMAEWTNIGASVAGFIQLEQVNEEIKTPSYCGDQMWVRCFNGQLAEDKMRLIIQRIEEGQLRGIAYLQNEDRSYRVFGEINEEDKYQLVLQSEDYEAVAEIQGAFQGLARQRAVFKRSDQAEQYLLLDLENNFYMGCVEYADYLSSYDVTYPKTLDAYFNQWMEKEVETWLQSCRDYTQTVREIHHKPQPPLRSSIRAYAWSDIDYYSPRLISGLLTFNNTWTIEPEGKSFNFDLEKGQEITLEDIFRKDFEANVFVLEYLHHHQLEYQWYQDASYRKWLSGRDFPYFTIRAEGICFGTAFNAVYGRHELTIPYEELKPYLKRKSPITHLLP